jgi:LacI family transcriptional regulator
MPVTLKDIAEHANVSQAAVSIALGSSGRIAEETRERILRIASDLGYRPNLLVKGIQQGRTQSVGVLMMFVDVFAAQLFSGVHDTLVRADYVPIVLSPCQDVPVLQQMHALLDRRVDGILMRPTGQAMWEQHLHEALDRDVPVVSMDVETQAETPHVDFVGTDDLAGARLAAQHFLSAGHRDLAVLSSGDFPNPMHFRRAGFEAAVGEAANATCVSLYEPWHDEIDGYLLAQRMLSLKPRPTAVFVTMDRLAAGVYRAAHEAGLRLPQDLSVIGFADEPTAAWLDPPLTTLRQRPYDLGQAAATLLLSRMSQDQARSRRERQLIEPELIERASVGSPSTA